MTEFAADRGAATATFRPRNKGLKRFVSSRPGVLTCALVVAAAVGSCGSSTASTTTTTSVSQGAFFHRVLEDASYVFVGKLNDSSGTKIALLVSKHFAIAYACNNAKVALLVGGKARLGSASMNNAAGAKATATYSALGASGTFSLPGGSPVPYIATPASAKAGFYQARALTSKGTYSASWVVGQNGISAGALWLNGNIVSNPPIAQTVSVGATSLTPERTVLVLGFPNTSVYPNNPIFRAPPSSGPL